MKKTKLELQEWECFAGKHKLRGGNRYSNHEGKFDCWKHTPYLKER